MHKVSWNLNQDCNRSGKTGNCGQLIKYLKDGVTVDHPLQLKITYTLNPRNIADGNANMILQYGSAQYAYYTITNLWTRTTSSPLSTSKCM